MDLLIQVSYFAAAFLFLKRSKEMFWAVCGYVVLGLELRGPSRLSRSPEPAKRSDPRSAPAAAQSVAPA